MIWAKVNARRLSESMRGRWSVGRETSDNRRADGGGLFTSAGLQVVQVRACVCASFIIHMGAGGWRPIPSSRRGAAMIDLGK